MTHSGAGWTITVGQAANVLRTMPEGSAQCCVTSPPYFGLRDYGVDGQIGLEPTPDAYVARLVDVFREVRRVLADDGTLWLNLGDSYASNGGNTDTNCSERRGQYRIGVRPEHEHRTRPFMAQTPDRKNPNAMVPTLQPNRAPLLGLKPKDLIGIPWMVAFALRADGWYLRSDIIWSKPNPMPESVRDRPTKAHEYLFLLSKSRDYHYDCDAIKEPSTGQGGAAANFARSTKEALVPRQNALQHRADREPTMDTGERNRRSVWTVASEPFPGAHFAVMPTELVRPCILAGCPVGGLVIDPFAGSGTVGVVARRLGRGFAGIELKPSYATMAARRIEDDAPLLNRAIG